MPAQYDSLFNIIRVSISGVFEDHDMLAYIEEGKQVITQTGCTRVLVDAREAILMLSEAASETRFSAFQQNFLPGYRMAILYKQIGHRQERFAQRAAKHGLAMNVFSSEWQALDWLLEVFAKS
jgi:hypothetical protein